MMISFIMASCQNNRNDTKNRQAGLSVDDTVKTKPGDTSRVPAKQCTPQAGKPGNAGTTPGAGTAGNTGTGKDKKFQQGQGTVTEASKNQAPDQQKIDSIKKAKQKEKK
jgi:hypothetical protein